jgi:hypothetical protein
MSSGICLDATAPSGNQELTTSGTNHEFSVWPGVTGVFFSLAGAFVLPALARRRRLRGATRLAFRTRGRSALDSVATSIWQVPVTCNTHARPLLAAPPPSRGAASRTCGSTAAGTRLATSLCTPPAGLTRHSVASNKHPASPLMLSTCYVALRSPGTVANRIAARQVLVKFCRELHTQSLTSWPLLPLRAGDLMAHKRPIDT